MQITQRGEEYVITYDLEAEGPVPVYLAASEDGSHFDLFLEYVSGEVGARVKPGSGKKMVWHAKGDFPDGTELLDLTLQVTIGPLPGTLKKDLQPVRTTEELLEEIASEEEELKQRVSELKVQLDELSAEKDSASREAARKAAKRREENTVAVPVETEDGEIKYVQRIGYDSADDLRKARRDAERDQRRVDRAYEDVTAKEQSLRATIRGLEKQLEALAAERRGLRHEKPAESLR